MHTIGLVPGMRIGDYLLEAPVGDGFEAVHVVLPRRVRLTIAVVPDDAVAIMREACILEALRHPGVPRVYEVGVCGSLPWFAAELVSGESLADPSRRFGVAEVVELLVHIADVLAYVHARGVVHGCVRPEAIVRDDSGYGAPMRLVDWDSASVCDPNEHARRFADDVFSLGLVADALLVARTRAPVELVMLVDDMLAPDPRRRPHASEVRARALELRDALEVLTDADLIEVPRASARATTPPPLPARARMRWTPATGINSSIASAVSGVIESRGTKREERE